MGEISAKAVKELRDRTGAGMMDCKRALGDADGDVSEAVDLLRERGLAKASKRGGRATSEGTISFAIGPSAGGMVELGCETDFVAKTPEYQSLAQTLAELVAGSDGLTDVDRVLAADLDGTPVSERITQTITTVGENIVLKRVTRLSVDGAGSVGGYVHAGGKLGVLIALATEAAADSVAPLAKDLAMHVAAVDPTPLAVARDGLDASVVDREREILRKQADQSGKPEQVIDKIVEGRLKKFFAEVCLVEQAFVKDPDKSIADLLEAVSRSAGSPVSVQAFERFKLGDEAEA